MARRGPRQLVVHPARGCVSPMTAVLPSAMVARLAATEQKHWYDLWTAQLRATCDGCAQDDRVMVVDEGVRLCATCHEAHLVVWRKEDEEDERYELLMDDLAFQCAPSLDDRFNAVEDRQDLENFVLTEAA